MSSLAPAQKWGGRAAQALQAEPPNACLVETEVVTNLVPHRRDHLLTQPVGIVAKVANERVAENQDLVWYATPADEGDATQPPTDVHAVRVVLATAIGDDDRHVLQHSLELERQLVERRANDVLKLLLAVMPVLAQ